MRARLTLVTGLIAAMALLPACGSSSKSGSSVTTVDPSKYVDKTAEKTVTIAAHDNTFDPQYVKISKGTTVVFENNGRNQHNVMSADGAFANIETDAFEPGTKVSRVITADGAHIFYCSLHGTAGAGMNGQILVVG